MATTKKKRSGRPPNVYRWSGRGIDGKVIAHTRSEARAMLKKKLGVPSNGRLPEYVLIGGPEKYVAA
jgi:hypothetical protein